MKDTKIPYGLEPVRSQNEEHPHQSKPLIIMRTKRLMYRIEESDIDGDLKARAIKELKDTICYIQDSMPIPDKVGHWTPVNVGGGYLYCHLGCPSKRDHLTYEPFDFCPCCATPMSDENEEPLIMLKSNGEYLLYSEKKYEEFKKRKR